MPYKSALVWDLHAAEPDGTALAERMHIEALAGARFHRHRGHAFGCGEIRRVCKLHVSAVSLDSADSEASESSDGGIIGEIVAPCCGCLTMRREERLERKALRRLRGRQRLARHRCGNGTRLDALQGLGDGKHGDRAT